MGKSHWCYIPSFVVIGHVTSIMSINFHFLVPESLHIKFGFDWPSGFWEKQVLSFVCKWPWAKFIDMMLVTWPRWLPCLDGLEHPMPYTKFCGNRPPVPEKKIFKGFEHFWAWRPSWSCDLDHLYKLSFPPSQGGSTWNLALTGQAVSEEKKFENVNGRRRTTYDGRQTPDHGYTISSPCEPEGSGELIRVSTHQCAAWHTVHNHICRHSP